MPTKLIKQLQAAEGRSEFVIAVVCDIRGFSQFSVMRESPDLAMFIKRFYLKLLEVYFKDASFAKPTGDGLLLVFKYSEKSLATVSERVLSTCFQVLTDFPGMFRDDPMINFETPSSLGFGIARGTACCLFSRGQILDYSGQLLNLAARLNDLARPQGIVIDGAYLEDVVPAQFRSRFKKERVYIKSLAEDSPRNVLCSNEVSLPSYSKFPLTSHEWIIETIEMKVSELLGMEFIYLRNLKHEILSLEKTKLEFEYPNTLLPGYKLWQDYRSFEYTNDAKGPRLHIELDNAKSIAIEKALPPDTIVKLVFQYVPKPSKKKKRRAK